MWEEVYDHERNARALKEKNSNEEPSANERPIYILLSLTTVSPAAHIAYGHGLQPFGLDHETH